MQGGRRQRIVAGVRQLLHRIGQFQSAVLLSLIYLVCWVPAGMLSRVMADWLRWRAPAGSNWRSRAARLNEPNHVREPF